MKFNPKRAVQIWRLNRQLAILRMRRTAALVDEKERERIESLDRLRRQDWKERNEAAKKETVTLLLLEKIFLRRSTD